jgi:hypothetical protein
MIFWISRDKTGLLTMHTNKPIKSSNSQIFISSGVSIVLPREKYPEVIFENSPQKYKLVKE